MRGLILAVFCLPTILHAQSVQRQIYQLPSGAAVRTAPPTGGFLNLPGAVKGQTQAQNPYVVLRDHRVQQGFRKTQWVEVAPIAQDGSINQSDSGWVLLPTDQDVDQQLQTFDGAFSLEAQQNLQRQLQTIQSR